MPPVSNDDLPIVDSAVLVATIQTIDFPPFHLASPIAFATRQAAQQLRIVLVSSLFNAPSPLSSGAQNKNEESSTSSAGHRYGISRTRRWDEVQRLLTYVYVQATKITEEMNKILMDVDVLLHGTDTPIPEFLTKVKDIPRIYRVKVEGRETDDLPSAYTQHNTNVVWLEPSIDSHTNPLPPIRASLHPHDPSLPPLFPVTALGGTFDHLHAGHKILLSMAAWITNEKLIVGITDDELLKNKINKEVLEPLPVRIERTRNFLTLFNPSIKHDIVPITDVYGPTAWDPNVQALVVSRETISGGNAIEKLRREKGLSSLKTFVIDVISATEACLDAEDASVLKKDKMSSTHIREWIVQQQQQQKVKATERSS